MRGVYSVLGVLLAIFKITDANLESTLASAFESLTHEERCGIEKEALLDTVRNSARTRRAGVSMGKAVATFKDCAAGTFAVITTNKSAVPSQRYHCQPCPIDTYQPLPGQLNCTACPTRHSTSWQTGRTQSSACQCALGSYLDSGKCIACTPNAVCTGRNIKPWAMEGFWTKNGQVVIKCFFTECTGGDFVNPSKCGADANGNLCAECSMGYFRYGQSCKQCPDSTPGKAWSNYIMPLFTYLFVPVILTYYLTNSKYPSLATTLRHVQRFHLIHTFPLHLPPFVRKAVDWFGICNIMPQMAMWECGSPWMLGPYEYCLHLALPVRCVLLLFSALSFGPLYIQR